MKLDPLHSYAVTAALAFLFASPGVAIICLGRAAIVIGNALARWIDRKGTK